MFFPVIINEYRRIQLKQKLNVILYRSSSIALIPRWINREKVSTDFPMKRLPWVSSLLFGKTNKVS